MTSRNVTGVWIPCTGLVHAATVATEYQLASDVLKVGKNQGQWYCEIIFSKA